MLALSHQCNSRRASNLISVHQSRDPASSMNSTEVECVSVSGNVVGGVAGGDPSDNMKLDRHASREPMEVALSGSARELDKLVAGLIFKCLNAGWPTELAQRQRHHHRQPSSDIFLRTSSGSGDGGINHRTDEQNCKHQQEHQHNKKHNNHLPFVVADAAESELASAARRFCSCSSSSMSARKTRSLGASVVAALAASAPPPSLAQSSFKIPSRSSSSLMLALICHIVIISLIFHQLPANNQAFAWSASHQYHQRHHDQQQKQQHQHEQQEQRQHPHQDVSTRVDQSSEQQHTKSNDFGSFMADGSGGAIELVPREQIDDLRNNDGATAYLDRMIFDSLRDNSAIERTPRHLIDNIGWNRHSAVHKRQQHSAEPDCQKLAVFWAFLQRSYPALSSHLFQWATKTEGRSSASDEQFLWSKSSSSARSIGHLLDDAERLVANQQTAHSAGVSQPSSWLQRISSNPTYARLVHHLRSAVDRLHKPATATTTTTTTNTPPLVLSGDRSSGYQQAGSETATSDGEQMMAAPAHQQHQQAHYGRVVHFPHEIGNTDNSNGMARTLDKLRVLSQQARQQERQIHRDNEAELLDIESNRILPPAQDVDIRLQQQLQTSRPLDSDSVESARDNYVYGKVLLRPQHANDFSSDSPRDRLSTLRELASEQQRQLLASGAKMETSLRSLDNQTPDSQYGRIIMSPPSSASSDQSMAKANDGDNHHQQAGANQPLSATDRMIDSAQSRHLFTADYSPRPGTGMDVDELSSQQKSHRVALNEGQGEEEEFEGVFHPGPLKEIEVRQLRSIDHKRNPQNETPMVELQTTRKPEPTTLTSTAKH